MTVPDSERLAIIQAEAVSARRLLSPRAELMTLSCRPTASVLSPDPILLSTCYIEGT